MNSLVFYLPIITVLVIYIARVMELRTKRETIAGQVREKLTLRIFILTGTLTLVGSIAEYVITARGVSWLLYFCGVTCGLLSFWIRRRAIAALGKFWSLHVEIRENHQLVRSGPFRFVRHPAYLSMAFELLALTLTCNARLTLLVVPLVFIPALILRIRIEEQALVEKLGTAYVDYQRTTPALFPHMWRTK